MNFEIIFDLTAHNRAAQTFFSIYERRHNNPTETSVQDLIDLARKRSITLAPAEVEAFFSDLDRAQCGRFLSGDSARSTRFVWIVSAIEAAKEAANAVAIDIAALKVLPASGPTAPAEPPVAMVEHSLRLRCDLMITLSLPADLSPDEARRLGLFIAALPLEN